MSGSNTDNRHTNRRRRYYRDRRNRRPSGNHRRVYRRDSLDPDSRNCRTNLGCWGSDRRDRLNRQRLRSGTRIDTDRRCVDSRCRGNSGCGVGSPSRHCRGVDSGDGSDRDRRERRPSRDDRYTHAGRCGNRRSSKCSGYPWSPNRGRSGDRSCGDSRTRRNRRDTNRRDGGYRDRVERANRRSADGNDRRHFHGSYRRPCRDGWSINRRNGGYCDGRDRRTRRNRWSVDSRSRGDSVDLFDHPESRHTHSRHSRNRCRREGSRDARSPDC
jgi:hypothetical protein